MTEWVQLALLVAIGGGIALFRILIDQQKTLQAWSVWVGLIGLGAATSLVAGLLLLQFPDISIVVLVAAGAALGLLGSAAVEKLLWRVVK